MVRNEKKIRYFLKGERKNVCPVAAWKLVFSFVTRSQNGNSEKDTKRKVCEGGWRGGSRFKR